MRNHFEDKESVGLHIEFCEVGKTILVRLMGNRLPILLLWLNLKFKFFDYLLQLFCQSSQVLCTGLDLGAAVGHLSG